MTSVEWVEGQVRFIDQTRLPAEEVYIRTADYREVGEAIRRLSIRGAPAIGVAAGFALSLAANNPSITTNDQLNNAFYDAVNFLARTRPTAVNLFVALGRMRRALEHTDPPEVDSIRRRLLEEALAMQREDIDACKRIGELGATLIQRGSTILTHCNTGELATAGSGTAQSVITTAAGQGKVARVFVDETRPLFQGARLTAWELLKQGVDAILITDSTAGLLMKEREINAVIVGADRIAANGDTANKIGTYALAVLARHHNVPFYVAAPMSTIDEGTPTGRYITVEERSDEEVTHVAGTRIAAEGVRVFAPAFDVTPNELITAIITERGILYPPFDTAILRLSIGTLPATVSP
ncbi:MAG: S-methyl-5-thioribose-1-phosphate isomerase [Bacteroidota bacterium]